MNEEWIAIECPDGKLKAMRAALSEDAERLVTAVDTGEHRHLAALARKLLKAAQEQFRAEEERLRGVEAPSLERHRQEHERFLADLGSLLALAARGDTPGVVALRPERWIPEWLSAHAHTDRDLAA
jgi:hemerythrin